jgi:hypothetical protein
MLSYGTFQLPGLVGCAFEDRLTLSSCVCVPDERTGLPPSLSVLYACLPFHLLPGKRQQEALSAKRMPTPWPWISKLPEL